MATRPIVPRANGEGSLGVSTKSWGGVFTNELNGANAVDMADFSKATLRQSSTAYVVGAMAYHATLPTGWYLECTTAGTTGSGTLTITTPTVGGTVSDGTVTWTIRKSASTQDLSEYMPLSGGDYKQRTGQAYTAFNNIRDNSAIVIRGGTNSATGAQLALHGQNYTNGDISELASAFGLKLESSIANKSIALEGKLTGTLTWGGNSLDKSAVVAESLGHNGYRKYASGLIEQWGEINIPVSEFSYSATYDAIVNNMGTAAATITYPMSFSTKARLALNIMGIPSNNKWLGYAQGVAVTTTKCNASVALNKGTTLNSTGNVTISWSAIGY